MAVYYLQVRRCVLLLHDHRIPEVGAQPGCFDLPPLFTGDDSIGFLRNVDCALIVVAAEETPMSQIDTAERQVSELTQVMGVVLNKCRITSDDYSYDYSGY